jgi:hypothetical protein
MKRSHYFWMEVQALRGISKNTYRIYDFFFSTIRSRMFLMTIAVTNKPIATAM